MVTEFEVHTAFGKSIRLWTDLRLTNQIASFNNKLNRRYFKLAGWLFSTELHYSDKEITLKPNNLTFVNQIP